MLKNRIIPCLDVKNGRVVKGINFVDLKDAGDPVEQAKIYSDGGADEICFLDITASNENRDIIYDVVEKTSKKCFVPLTVGGGIKSSEDINKFALLQNKMINNVSKFLKKDGFIIYATCSLEEQENWNVVKSFLKFNPNFELESVESKIPQQWLNSENCLETFPPRDNVDGMFAAKIRKC